jgi:hypothetical protein
MNNCDTDISLLSRVVRVGKCQQRRHCHHCQQRFRCCANSPSIVGVVGLLAMLTLTLPRHGLAGFVLPLWHLEAAEFVRL